MQLEDNMDKTETMSLQLPLTLVDILSIDLLVDSVAISLSTPDLLNLSEVSRRLQDIVRLTEGLFRRLDLSFESWNYCFSIDEVLKVLHIPYIARDAQQVILDGSLCDADSVIQLLQIRKSRLSVVSIRSCAALDPRTLTQKLFLAAKHPDRVCGSMKLLLLAGPPWLPHDQLLLEPNQINHAAAACGLKTDLVPCRSPDHEHLSTQELWALAVPFKTASVCSACHNVPRPMCRLCWTARTCGSCHEYTCAGCPISAKRGCYECGKLCTSCANERLAICTCCKATFCLLHKEKQCGPGGSILCDWCHAGGVRTYARGDY
ncbi:hypothetical protein G7K_4996-t1 [Saitoella complicata NRRL Y-17804]|uniref:Uncharacterized protein n=1 Tax=Saitoella complicata (strain BCRC 22490 / CBS 7301 / JCM 7358 / NBRC 10748 / NRRL Y-17804) TaxID=698492 RepID=A0A0E9NLY8_SAICN|nr:hypothetical protein G7K_4996-t1 [Saitoella complicata NRRL Y-17804]